MAICYFNNDYRKKYLCQYSINEESIKVTIDYSISEEIRTDYGIEIYSPETVIEARDILIVDSKEKKNMLLKGAVYIGHQARYGTPDSIEQTVFQAMTWFESERYDKLFSLPETPKIKSIRINSKSLLDYLRTKSVIHKRSDEENTIILDKKKDFIERTINKNNVRKLLFSDNWNMTIRLSDIIIQRMGCIEIVLGRKINYYEAIEYINEMVIYLQLYNYGFFPIDNIETKIDDYYVGFSCPFLKIKKKHRSIIDRSVDYDIEDFIKTCYEKIPYHKSKTEIRNIPYIVIVEYRGIEDNYLMLYRFIEAYYKRKNIPGIQSSFINYSMEHNLAKGNLSDEERCNISDEIVSLRNTYVHSGYYLKNSSLRVKRKKNSGKRNYTVTNIDTSWILHRVKLLKQIVIDIIFREMLGYEIYKYGD